MKKHLSLVFFLSFGFFVVGFAAAQNNERTSNAAAAQQYTAKNLLDRKPALKNIDCDYPNPEDIDKCTVSGSSAGYIVKDPNDRILRVFLRPSERGAQTSYYKNGIEVFRQLLSPSDSKLANEYRWMNNAGTRWGIADNRDANINRWKMISAEEVSMEAVNALVSKNAEQFLRLAPSAEELTALGLGTADESKTRQKVGQMRSEFAKFAQEIRLSPKAEWLQFNGGQPGIVPAGKDGNPDIIAYENVSAIIRDGENEIKQVILGTIVKVGENNWRLIGIPHLDDPNAAQIAEWTFFVPEGFADFPSGNQGPSPEQDALGELIAQLMGKQASLQSAALKDRAAIHDEILQIMLSCATLQAAQTSLEDADQWVRNAADWVASGVQANEYPIGPKRLESLFEKVETQFQSIGVEPAAYVKYMSIMADYYQRINEGKDQMETFVMWRQNLEKFVEEYGKTEGAARAMLELGGYYEMTHNEKEALNWYQQLARDLPQSDHGKRAAGAIRRIGAVGKTVSFTSKTASGGVFNLAQLKGNPVVLYFWDSRSETEFDALKQVAGRYKELKIVSVNVDDRAESMEQYLKQNPMPFIHVFDSVDGVSQAGQYWGLQIPPMMILIDADGKVVRQNITSVASLARLIEELK